MGFSQVAFDRFGKSVRYVSKKTIAGKTVFRSAFRGPHTKRADVYHAVPSEAQIAVVPKENSIFGSVVETYDLIRLPEVGKTKFIREELVLPIQHCLLVAKSTKLSDVQRVYSHEQVRASLREFYCRMLTDFHSRHLASARTS